MDLTGLVAGLFKEYVENITMAAGLVLGEPDREAAEARLAEALADPAKLDEKGKQSMERSRGPAGIRLSLQGPGGLERDKVSLRAVESAFQSVDVRAAIDIAAQPAIYYRHGYEGKFIGRRDRSQRRTKRKIL